MWPSHGVNVSKAVRKSLPPQSSWESISYKYLLGPYNSFEEAKSKEKDAEFVSSDDAKIYALQNKENTLPLKRTKKPKFYDSFNEELTDIDSIPEKKFKNIPTTSKTRFDDKLTLKQKKSVPNPPSNYKMYNKNLDTDVRKKDTQLEQDRCSSPSSDINVSQPLDYGDYFSQSKESFEDDIQKDSQRDIKTDKCSEKYSKNIKTFTNAFNMKEKRSVPVIKHIDYNPAHYVRKGMKYEFCQGKSDSALQIQEYGKQKYIETDINENETLNNGQQKYIETDINERETLNNGEKAQEGSINRILDTVLVINRKLDSMSTMNRKLDSILAFHDQNPSSLVNCYSDLLPEFPLNSMEDFKKFSNDLNENEELRKQFQKKIRNIGGKSVENHLINCLVIILTNELAKHLTWEGQRQTEGIKNTAFANIIIGTISNMCNSSNYYNLKSKFSEWLRRAGDRFRYQLKKKLEHT